MAKEIECRMCPFKCKRGKHMLVGDEPGERASIIINSVTEKIYPATPKPEGQPIVKSAFEKVFDPSQPESPEKSSKHPIRTIYVTGVCEVSGYSVGLMATHKK